MKSIGPCEQQVINGFVLKLEIIAIVISQVLALKPITAPHWEKLTLPCRTLTIRIHIQCSIQDLQMHMTSTSKHLL